MINIKKTKIYLEINSLDKRTETNETSSKTENKDNLEKVINAFKHVVSSEEWQEMENAIKDLTKEQKEKVEKFINTEIKPALWELKDTILDKEKRHKIIEKINNKIHELIDKIHNMKEKKENNYNNSEYIKLDTQKSLLNVALKLNQDRLAA